MFVSVIILLLVVFIIFVLSFSEKSKESISQPTKETTINIAREGEHTIIGNLVSINVKSFIKEYMNCIPFELYIDLSERSLKVASIEKSVYDEIVKRKREQDYFDLTLSRTAGANNEGKELEKEGKIQEAIAVYEENIKLEYPATHSYDRLMILYRKLKQKEDEIRVIKKAIEVFTKDNERRKSKGFEDKFLHDISKWEQRLEKLNK